MKDNQELTSKELNTVKLLNEAIYWDRRFDTQCDMTDDEGKMLNLIIRFKEQLTTTQQALDSAVEALKFYADESNWHSCGMGCNRRPEKDNGELDDGETAEAALASIKE